jgi:pimeloyl-ACP methyl ester carboxylesterase
MPHAKVNGIDVYFEQHGEDGDVLFFVHGYTGDVSDWRHQVAEFRETHRVLVMDNRGHGRSEAPEDRSAYSVGQMASDVLALADMLEHERFHLVGHSMGGAVAQEVALHSPGRLQSLTLHDTGHVFEFSKIEMIAKFTEYRNMIADQQGMPAVAAIQIPAPKPPHMPEERQAEERERLARMSPHAFIGASMGLNAWPGTADRLASIVPPTMVIYGDLDFYMLVESAKHMAKTIPNAVLEVVEQAGHSPQYERPELFNAALRRHLERSASVSAK